MDILAIAKELVLNAPAVGVYCLMQHDPREKRIGKAILLGTIPALLVLKLL